MHDEIRRILTATEKYSSGPHLSIHTLRISFAWVTKLGYVSLLERPLGVEPKIGGFENPQNGWFIYNGKPYEQMDDLRGLKPRILGSTPLLIHNSTGKMHFLMLQRTSLPNSSK